jgi:hypothetical protein
LNRLAKIIIGILATLGAFYVGVTLFLTFFFDGCTVYPIAQLTSPSGEYRARLSMRACEDEPYEKVTLYVTRLESPDLSHGAVLATNPRDTDFDLAWRSDKVLVVRHPASQYVENEPSSLGGVRLVFELNQGGT